MKNITLLVAFIMLIGVSLANAQKVKTGIEQLRATNFKSLAGKRVGLVTNPTGVDSKLKSTVDILFEAPNVNLVALYGPEHGVRGDYTAGDEINDDKDSRTGLPVFSLYGKTRKPTPEMLKNIDILVYDIQDIGSRSYTYISTLGMIMEAAAENNIEVMVLDRPNPLGGVKIEGALVEKEFTSFVSQYPIPYVHGLTCGELAKYLNAEGLLSNNVKCKLTVIPMVGWKRTMNFDETGLPWVLSSPHIPHTSSAYMYPVSGILGELHYVSIGVGYTLPFEVFATTWVTNAEKLADNLNAQKIPGIIFRPIHFKPYYGQLKDSTLSGVQVHIMEYHKAPLSIIQFYVMQELYKLYPEHNIFEENATTKRLSMFDKVCGTDKVRKAFEMNFKVNDIINLWTKDVEPFRQKVKPYLLYN